MTNLFQLAELRILLALNHTLAADQSLYLLGLLLTDKLADVVTLLTILTLWFWPQPKKSSVLSPVRLPPAEAKARRSLFGGQSPELKAATRPFTKTLTRSQSRAQLLVFITAGMLAYVVARVLAQVFNVDRPFTSLLPLESLPGVFDDLRTYGSFPSDHAALIGAFQIGMFYWNRKLGWCWLVFGILLAISRVAVGFHYPSDMLVGAAIGAILAWKALELYGREGTFQDAMDTVVRGFEPTNAPYCYFLYAFAGLIGLEFVMHFQHVLEAMQHAQGELMWRFRK